MYHLFKKIFQKSGLAFIGLSLTRYNESEFSNKRSITRQTQFDFNLLQDREYKYFCSTNDDGWLVGICEALHLFLRTVPLSPLVSMMQNTSMPSIFALNWTTRFIDSSFNYFWLPFDHFHSQLFNLLQSSIWSLQEKLNVLFSKILNCLQQYLTILWDTYWHTIVSSIWHTFVTDFRGNFI